MLSVSLFINFALFFFTGTNLGIYGWSTSHGVSIRDHNKYDAIHDLRHCNHNIHHRKSVATHLQLSTIDDSTTEHIIKVIHQPDSNFLSSQGVLDWPTWGCPISKFPWSYSDTEICYLIRGKVIITPIVNNQIGPSSAPVTIVAGDYVILTAGLSCTWDVIEAVEKHYTFN